MKRPPARNPFARSVVAGLVVLAVIAIILAWMDDSGYSKAMLHVLERSQANK